MTDRKGITPISAPVASPSDLDDLPVHLSNEQQGGMKLFADKPAMNAFGQKYKTRLFESIAIVGKGENDFPSIYHWTGKKPGGTDGSWEFAGYFGGVVLADADGAIPKIRSTIVLGSDFEIQEAGNQGFGALLQLSQDVKDAIAKKASSDGEITVGRMHGDYAQYKTKGLFFGPYLELNERKKGPSEPISAVDINVKPGIFQPASTTGYLAYLKYPDVVIGKAKMGEKYRKGTIWMDIVAVSSNGMLQLDKPNKAIGLQETDFKDPNVTGGTKFLVWPFVYLEGVAPDDGYVELVWYEKDTGAIATDINGHAMAVRHNYKRGQELTPKHDPLTFAQVIAAKGVKEYALAIVDNFDDFIRVKDYSEGPTGICIQEISEGGNASEALTKAEVDTGFNVRVEAFYAGTYLASANYIASIPEPSQVVPAGSFVHSASEFEMYAVTDIEFAVTQGQIQISAKDLDIGDFYGGLVINPELAQALSGKTISVDVSLIDKNCGWVIAFYTYTGDLSKRPPLYTSRNNMSPILSAGWTEFHNEMISEDVVSGLHAQSFTATIPKDAQFVMAAIYPVEAQNPLSLQLKSFTLNNANPETLYEISALNIAGLQHIDFITESVKLVQDTQGFASLRYTINDAASGNPMPMGIPQSKMRYLHLDKTLNVIQGSGAKGGEGALIDDEPTSLTIYQKWQLYNEQAASHEAEFWLVLHKDSDGNEKEIPGSRTTFTVDSKRPGVDYFQTNSVTVQLDPGDYVYARASSDVKDGAYAQTNAKSSPLCITYVTGKGIT